MTNMTKQTEAISTERALKLALEALVKALPDMPVHTDWHLEAITALREALTSVPDWASKAKEQPAPATELREQEPVSDRENAIIRFALHQFMSNAYSHMNAAAQDKDSRHYTVSAVEKFAKDAKDAEALLSRLQFKAQKSAQRTWVNATTWRGLTVDEILYCVELENPKAIVEEVEAKLREKNGITKEQT